MADEPTNTDTASGTEPVVETQHEQEQTFTQADLDRVVSDRLRREREKYGDYDDIKSKASKLDELEAENQSELEKLTNKVGDLAEDNKTTKAENLRLRVAMEKSVPSDLIDRLRGETREELEADAEKLLAFVKPTDATDFDPGARDTSSSKTPEAAHADLIAGLLGRTQT